MDTVILWLIQVTLKNQPLGHTRVTMNFLCFPLAWQMHWKPFKLLWKEFSANIWEKLCWFFLMIFYSITLQRRLFAYIWDKFWKVYTKNQLYAKLSKCTFFQKKLQFLGHIISRQGVSLDLEKLIAMQIGPFLEISRL